MLRAVHYAAARLKANQGEALLPLPVILHAECLPQRALGTGWGVMKGQAIFELQRAA